MFKDILVHIPADQRADAVIDCAVSLAQIFDAHLDGVGRVYRSFNPAIAVGASSAVSTVVTQFEPDARMASSALQQFQLAATEAGIRHGSKTIRQEASSVVQSATELSRLYGLVVVPQPDSQAPSSDDSLAEAVLLGCGRPLLLIPYIQREPLDARHVLICWDGGARAARAVHEAMPFLRRATAIDIVVVNGGEAAAENAPEALKAHLGRRGISANVRRVHSEASDVHDVILSLAADMNADLIVMGGYGHSRIREYMLGGVTRGIIETMTVPTLISH